MNLARLLSWLREIGLEEIFLFVLVAGGFRVLWFIRLSCPTFCRYIINPLHRTYLRLRLRAHGLRIIRVVEADNDVALLSINRRLDEDVEILKALEDAA